MFTVHVRHPKKNSQNLKVKNIPKLKDPKVYFYDNCPMQNLYWLLSVEKLA